MQSTRDLFDLTKEKNIHNLLGTLNTDSAKMNLLKSAYTPGSDVADIILSINPEDTSVMESEINYAIEHGMPERAINMAEKYFNHSIGHSSLYYVVRDNAIKLKNKDIADIAIAKLTMTTKIENGRDESAFERAVEIAEAFNEKERAREFLTELLKYQMQQKSEYSFSPAGTCAKLGRYDESIDLYLMSSYGWISNALEIAREHAPKKLKEVAQKGFNTYRSGLDSEIYVECANILGKTEEAKDVLTKEAKELWLEVTPRHYNSLVNALMKLGLGNEAKNLVINIGDREIKKSEEKEERYDSDAPEELAKILNEVGVSRDKTNYYTYLIRVNWGLNKGHQPSEIIENADKGYELTQNPVFLKKKIIALEMAGKFNEAAIVAAHELEDPDLAGKYRTMAEMVRESNADSA